MLRQPDNNLLVRDGFMTTRLVKHMRHAMIGLLPVILVACSSGGGSGDGGDDPVVKSDSYRFMAEGVTTIAESNGVLSNDDADFTQVEIKIQPNSSSAFTLNSDGSFSYTPNSGVTNDSFTYTATTSNGNESTGKVDLQLASANDSCNEVNFSETLSFTVTAPSVDQRTLSYSLSTPEKGDILSFNTLTGQGTYKSFAAGARGADDIVFTATDDAGVASTGKLNIIITPTRIMPLGDSLTEGVGHNTAGSDVADTPPRAERIGYRSDLYNSLTAKGYQIDFVGNRNNGSSASPSIVDSDHEGHPGITDLSITKGINGINGANSGWLVTAPPDVVLLHAGTNNVNGTSSSGAGPGSAVNMGPLLDAIDAYEASHYPVRVLLAKIIGRNNSGGVTPNANSNVTTFNNQVTALFNSRVSNTGDDLVLVDMFSAVPYSTTNGNFDEDMIHLEPKGYKLMANQWESVLLSSGSLTKCD